MPRTKSRISWQQALRYGLALKCPACGRGKLFQSYLKPVSFCQHCGLKLDQGAGADGPSFFVMFLVIIIVPIAALSVEMAYAPPAWLHMVLWLPLTLGLSLILLPFFKGAFIALEYINRTDFFDKKHKS